MSYPGLSVLRVAYTGAHAPVYESPLSALIEQRPEHKSWDTPFFQSRIRLADVPDVTESQICGAVGEAIYADVPFSVIPGTLCPVCRIPGCSWYDNYGRVYGS